MKDLPIPSYVTRYGKAYQGDALNLLQCLPNNSVDLVITSPPFALQRQKSYGNENQDSYIDWLIPFAIQVKRVLKDTGSFVLELGGSYQKGKPIRSLYNYRVLIKLCDELEFKLAEEFFWFNPAKLPSPLEWVNKRKIRTKDAVNTIWWLSKTDFPKADVTKVKVPYSDRMKKLLKNAEEFYKPKERPSGHEISENFSKDNGGAIPSNLLQIANTDSNSQYIRFCKEVGIKPHPARFPKQIPTFFIKFLTDPGDLVLDIFAGSNTTGYQAEELERYWLAFESNPEYIANSMFRFLKPDLLNEAYNLYSKILSEKLDTLIVPQLDHQLTIYESTP